MKLLSFIVISLLLNHACSSHTDQERVPTQKQVNKGMEQVNRQLVNEEDAVIEGYIERRGWNMIKTGTGVHIEVYQPGPEGPNAAEGQVAVVNYVVSLIDGTEVYSSEQDGSRSFLIGQDNVESGLHEAITYMKIGDRARVILPSYRAHGLTGDNDRIPPRSTVIYDLELLELRG